MVPFVDLKQQYNSIRGEILKEVEEVFSNTEFILGKKVELFEKNFADFCGKKYCIGVNSGTSALHVALLSYGIGLGDEVITVPNTFIATAEAISHSGAKPVFVDINEKTFTMNPEKLEKAITKKTKAIMPVHLFGQPADMKPIIEIAEKHSLKIIEDCAQSHGAQYLKKVVPVTETGCFSFYPAKNLGAFGEAGAVVTDSIEVFEKSKLFRAHGENPKGTHSVVGYNYRIEGIQGAILNTKLKYLNSWINARRKNAKLFNELLSESNVSVPFEADYAKHAFHLYIVKSNARDKLKQFLDTKTIGTGIHYPSPIHLQKAYAFLGLKEKSFPVAENSMKQILSLPMFPELSAEQIEYVCNAVKEFK
ncbi:MAG: DegT/DnrJ/EryC1/StrS family aminotransferase [archaeon]|nr:DegT/DnrJ/EryC1/StrS family aminotransferase [archaeon]